MACACPSLGSQAVYLVEAGAGAGTFDALSERYALDSHRLIGEVERVIDQFTTGSRSQFDLQDRDGNTNVAGPWMMRPGQAELDSWLPRILGAAEAADQFFVADALPVFSSFVNTGANKFEFNDLAVNRATFRAQSGQSLEMELELLGKTYTVSTQTPALPDITVVVPLLMKQAVLLIDSVDYCFSEFEIVINNNLEPLFFNSATAKCIEAGEREVTISVGLPWDTNVGTDVYGAGAAGAPISIAFTPGAGLATTFNLPHVRWVDRTATVETVRGIPWTLEGRALSQDYDGTDGTAREIYVVNDRTPTP